MLEKIQSDFANAEGPFSNKEELLPERDVLEKVPKQDHLAVLSYGVMLDYNRNASQLWDNILELYEREPAYFEPQSNKFLPLKPMQELFEDIGFRYHHRDAKGWRENSQILNEEFGGSWSRLLKEAEYDAETLAEFIEDAGFKYLKGEKLKPFYCKVVHENITELDNIWTLDIPVDVHIRRLTQDLAGEEELTDDEIRAYWRERGREEDIDPMVVDGALWLIGNNWDDWGKVYWAHCRVLSDEVPSKDEDLKTLYPDVTEETKPLDEFERLPDKTLEALKRVHNT